MLRPGGRFVFAGEPTRHGDYLARRLSRFTWWAATQRHPPAAAGRLAPPAGGAGRVVAGGRARGRRRHPHVRARRTRGAGPRAGAAGVRVTTSELLASWFGWPVRTFECAVPPGEARHALGELRAARAGSGCRVDARLEGVVPRGLFYNAEITGTEALTVSRRSSSSTSTARCRTPRRASSPRCGTPSRSTGARRWTSAPSAPCSGRRSTSRCRHCSAARTGCTTSSRPTARTTSPAAACSTPSPTTACARCWPRPARPAMRLAVATSKPEIYAVPMVKHLGLARRTSRPSAATSSTARCRRKALVIGKVLARLGEPDPRDVVMVGDREHDVYGAREHGSRCIGAGWGYGRRGSCSARAPSRSAPRPRELLAVLGLDGDSGAAAS